MKNRIIKFRTFDKIKSEMVYNGIDYEMRRIQFTSTEHENSETIPIGFNKCDFEQFEIMQFTGLLDRNGQEIYEGDIFQVAANKKYTVKYMESGTSNYELIAATFVLWFNDELFFPFDEYAMANGNVIGNLFEHPRLLTK